MESTGLLNPKMWYSTTVAVITEIEKSFRHHPHTLTYSLVWRPSWAARHKQPAAILGDPINYAGQSTSIFPDITMLSKVPRHSFSMNKRYLLRIMLS